MNLPPFHELLHTYRQGACMSQDVLGRAAGFDHSFISRLESGQRMPSRETVVALARVLRLDARDTDRLLASARFLPERVEHLLEQEPEVAQALAFLRDERVPAERRDDVRNMIDLLVRQARRVAQAEADDAA